MRQNYAKWGGGIGRWWEMLRSTRPRSRIAPGVRGRGVCLSPSLPLLPQAQPSRRAVDGP